MKSMNSQLQARPEFTRATGQHTFTKVVHSIQVKINKKRKYSLDSYEVSTAVFEK